MLDTVYLLVLKWHCLNLVNRCLTLPDSISQMHFKNHVYGNIQSKEDIHINA